MDVTQVRVTKAGNSRMLPVPAELARAANAEQGDTYTVELLGDDIVYHRAWTESMIVGSGSNRMSVVPSGRPMRMSGPSGVLPLDDWDF